MRVVKLLMSLLPLAYIGWILTFLVRPDPGEGALSWAMLPSTLMATGLGPTVLGLIVVGGLFCIPVLFRLYQLVAPAAPKRSTTTPDVEEDGTYFDADAALARYLARKAELGREPQAIAEAAPIQAAPRPSFGRKPV